MEWSGLCSQMPIHRGTQHFLSVICKNPIALTSYRRRDIRWNGQHLNASITHQLIFLVYSSNYDWPFITLNQKILLESSVLLFYFMYLCAAFRTVVYASILKYELTNLAWGLPICHKTFWYYWQNYQKLILTNLVDISGNLEHIWFFLIFLSGGPTGGNTGVALASAGISVWLASYRLARLLGMTLK